MLRVDSLASMYREIGMRLLETGDVVYPRGMETREIISPVIQIDNPRARLAFLPERKFNVVYALVESLMLFNKEDKLSYFSQFNENMKNFSDDGVHLYGAYGNRFANFIPNIINKLKEDEDSRQAILTIYNNDCNVKTKDIPCTLNLHFLIRDDKLNMIAYMRSNDIIWGTPYDIFMFTMLQEVVANSLGIELGWYRHIPSSLHVYSQHYELLEKMSKCESVEFANPFKYGEYKNIANMYTAIIDNIDNEDFWAIMMDKDSKTYINIILNELNYRGLTGASDDGHRIIRKYPDWAKPFTNRWHK